MAKKTFQEWMKMVDAKISAKLFGLSSADLPDCPYRDWYDDGMSAASAASRAIRMARE